MGNSTPVTEKLEHPRLGPVAVVEKDGRRLMQYTVSVHNDESQKEWEEILKEVKAKREFETMFLPEEFQIERVPCGISRNLKALYPLFPFSLTYEISTRILQKVPFEEKELQYLLFELVNIAKQFEKIGKKAGNFKPDNVLINQDGQLSFICKYSYPGFTDGYTSALYDKQSSYLAPEEMEHLATSDERPDVDPNRAEAFSIGITVLAAGLLEDLEPTYNFKQGKFNQSKFQEYLTQWRSNPKYSLFLKDVVQKLLIVNPNQRLTPAEMRAYLNPYGQQIRVLESYEPNIELSEKSLSQYRTNKQYGKTEEIGQQPKTIRQLGAKFKNTSRDTNPIDRSRTINQPANNIDLAKTTRQQPYVPYTYHHMPPAKVISQAYYPATTVSFSYGAPIAASSLPISMPYSVSHPQPKNPPSSIMAPTTYATIPPHIAQNPTLATSPNFPSATPAVSENFVATSRSFNQNSPENAEQKFQKTSVQQMLNDFKTGLAGQKELKTQYQDEEPEHHLQQVHENNKGNQS